MQGMYFIIALVFPYEYVHILLKEAAQAMLIIYLDSAIFLAHTDTVVASFVICRFAGRLLTFLRGAEMLRSVGVLNNS